MIAELAESDGLPVLSTPRVTLRIAGPDAAALSVDFNRENEAFLTPWEPAFTPLSFDVANERLVRERAVVHARNGTAYSFAITAAGATTAAPIIGWLNFHNVIRGIFRATVMGYKLDRRMQGQGLMTEAASAGIEYLFGTQRLHRIGANYMPHNQRSAAVLRRLGFQIEGTAKAYLFIGGEWRDHVLTSLTNPEPIDPYEDAGRAE